MKIYEMIIHNLDAIFIQNPSNVPQGFSMSDLFVNALTSLAEEFPRLGSGAERIASETELSGN